MVVVGGGWVVLSLHSPLLYGCCRRGFGCIKSSLTSAVWLLRASVVCVCSVLPSVSAEFGTVANGSFLG